MSVKHLSLLIGSLVVAAACSSEPTSVRVKILYPPQWQLDSLVVKAGGMNERVRVAPEVIMLVPEDWAGQSLTITVDGWQEETRFAHGEVEISPIVDEQVTAMVTLAQLPCGAWCTPMDTICRGDQVATCVQREDTCMEWSAAVTCPGAASTCSLGVCAATCVNECVSGETRCAGPGAVVQCGQVDSDACTDWTDELLCATGETCSNGACTKVCQDECEPGQTRCTGTGTATCGDLNFDGCLEWSPEIACPGGQSCSNGSCSAVCTDECSAATCAGLDYTTCGQFDFDSCRDRSPGVSCVPTDPCRVGACSAAGCSSTAKICNAPPAPICVNDQTLRSFGNGSCSSDTGSCSYLPTDVRCASGCVDGACRCTALIEEVDSDALASGILLAADSSDRIHLTNGTDSYAFKPSGGKWSTPVSITSLGGGYPSLAVDSTGVAHVIVVSPSNFEVEYLSKAPSSIWKFGETIAGSKSTTTSLAADAAGNLHGLYYTNFGGQDLVYVSKIGSAAFTSTLLASDGESGFYHRIVVDRSGGLHVTYTDSLAGQIKYLFKASQTASWTTATPVTAETSTAAQAHALAVDDGGGLHLVFRVPAANLLRYAYRPAAGAWSTPIDLPVELGGRAAGIAVDATRAVYVTYYLEGGGVKYMFKPAGGAWSSSKLIDAAANQPNTAVTVDRSGVAHVAYFEDTKIKHAVVCPR
jgi:hypothetical protein